MKEGKMYEIGRFLYEIETRYLRIASGERTPPSLPFKGRDREKGSPPGEGKTFLADF